jgi:hypothetical protein
MIKRFKSFYVLSFLLIVALSVICCPSPQPTDSKSKEVNDSTFINGGLYQKTDFEKFYFEFCQDYVNGDSDLIIQHISDSLLTRGGLDFYPEVAYLSKRERLEVIKMFFEQQLGLSLSDSSFRLSLKSYFSKCQNEYEKLKYKNASKDFQRRCNMQFVKKASKWYVSYVYLDDKTIKDLDNIFHRGGLPEGWDD